MTVADVLTKPAAVVWVRTTITAVTTYRLVLLCLGSLAVAAVGLSAVGLLSYPLLAMLATLSAALLGSYLSNRVMSSLFGVTPHSESSLITGLLIFFIFPPSLHALPLLGVALAGMLASGSKYILAVRGRHLFNPAAAGAFLLGLTGFYFSGWWVGTPAMLPFTLLAAAAVLYRVRRVRMGLLFVALAGSVMVVRSLAAGIDLPTALVWPLTSSPMIFFAGLMLSEPLTQPPLRWQQYAYAGVIGFFFSTPLHLGAVYLAPESALLIGNALAFLAGQRRGIELTLERRAHLTPTIVEFAFRPSRRLRFRPGQWVELTLPHRHADNRGLRRVFSIASAPGSELVKIGTRVPDEPSTFKHVLGELTEGSVVTATSVAGDFLLPRDLQVPLLLVAGGIGITPFASQIEHLDPDQHRDVVLVYVVRDATDISYREVLEASGVPVVLVSEVTMTDLPAHWTAVHARRLTGPLLEESVPDIATRTVYISGAPAMVAATATAARKLDARAVRTDFFNGY